MRLTAVVLLLAAPLATLPAQGIPVTKDADPTRKVAAGAMPAGWQVRLDAKDTTRYTIADTRFVGEGAGWRVTSGPAALYYNPSMAQTGNYTLRATLTSPTAPRHAEAYGVFVGGRDLENPMKQDYAYFLVRGDGQWMLSHRAGPEVHRIHPWTPNAAVNKRDATGRVTDQLEVRAAADSVRFLVNGAQMVAFERKYFGANGQVGLRVNHNLDVQVEKLEIVPGTP